MPVRPLILFAASASEAVLRENGLGSLEDIFRRAHAAQIRHTGRAVWKTQLRLAGGQSLTAYVKLSWGRRRWWPRLADIRTGQVLKSLAVREWEGLEAFERLGFHVPERLSLFEEGLLWKRSALILLAVPPPVCLSDMILQGSWLHLPSDDRHSILEEVARTLYRIHASGWAWRSISTRHIYPQRKIGGGWELWLIDCEGVHRAGSVKILDRDFRRFLRALSHDGADRHTLDVMREIAARTGSLKLSGGGQPNAAVRAA
jgi:hypothetical protein